MHKCRRPFRPAAVGVSYDPANDRWVAYVCDGCYKLRRAYFPCKRLGFHAAFHAARLWREREIKKLKGEGK